MPYARLLRVTTGTVLALGSSLACSDDTVSSSGDSSADGTTSADETGASESNGTDGSESSGETGDELPPELGGAARGLSIVSVEVNQGIGVDVVRDGEEVAIDQRNAKVIRDRDTLIRVQHVIDDPEVWLTRSVTGILHIETPEGEELIRTRSFVIEADSDPRQLDTSFYFSLLAAEARPGTSFWIELLESDASVDVSAMDAGEASTPDAGFGFDDTALEFRVVMVPVRYEYLDPPTEPDITADDLALFHDYLLQQNPVQTIHLEIRDQPMVRTQQLTNLGSLLNPTREAKLADGAADNVYYHALVDVGGPSISMVAGIANLAGSGKGDSDRRVAATVYFKQITVPKPEDEDQTPKIFPPVNSARTFVHEIGHNQGFSHIACPNADAAGPDPSYPYADGLIGGYGFGIRDFHVYTPGASHDYMTYCGNSWVSDWTWNKAFSRIATLTSWDGADAGGSGSALTTAATATVPVLVGLISADGTEEWTLSTARPRPAPASGNVWVEVESALDGVSSRADAHVDRLSDDSTLLITAPLALPHADLATLRWHHDGRSQTIVLAPRPN